MRKTEQIYITYILYIYICKCKPKYKQEMGEKRKLIDLPEEVISFLKIKAADERISVKSLIERLIIDEYKRSKKEEDGRK